MRHTTGHHCPVCGEDHVVVAFTESEGHDGKWYCFNCHSHGHAAMIFDVADTPSLPPTGGESAPEG